MLEKVGIFIEDSKFGGPQKLLVDIFKNKIFKDKTKIFLSKENNNIFKKILNYNKINFHEIDIIWPKKNFFGLLFFFVKIYSDIIRIIKVIKKNNISIIYVFGGASNFRTIIAAKILNKKIIWHLHESKISSLIKFIFVLVYNKNMKIIFSSYASKIYYNKIIKIKRFDVIRSGISINQSSKKNKKIKLNKKIVISNVANINEDKNLEFFIGIANYCLNFNKNLNFKIYGNVWPNKINYFKKLKNQIRYKNSIKIIQNKYDYNQIHKKTDIYLCTSINESSPIAVWEAMSIGKIVLCSPAGDLKFTIKNNYNGFLIKNYNIKTYAEKIFSIIKNFNKLNNLKKNAIKTILTNYNIEDTFVKINNILVKIGNDKI